MPQKIISKKFGAKAVSVITLQQQNSNINLKIKKKNEKNNTIHCGNNLSCQHLCRRN